eukprot:m.119004 g.119004  ORF g.119004 m.119004 type:complete len:297 (-) comp15580_c0_seq34:86-976(-)
MPCVACCAIMACPTRRASRSTTPKPEQLASDLVPPVCTECHTAENVCACLICGTLVCGRQVNRHALSHCQEHHFQHRYVIELETERVWDHALDRYVHVVAEHSHSGADKPGTVDPDKGKQVALQEEFVTLLSQQLASQRQYFQMQLRRLDRDNANMYDQHQRNVQHLAQLQRSTEAQLKHVQAVCSELESERDQLDQRLKVSLCELVGLRKKRKALSATTQAQRRSAAQATQDEATLIHQLKQQVTALTEEIRDLEIHKVQASQLAGVEDAADSHVIITSPAETGRTGRRQRRPRK